MTIENGLAIQNTMLDPEGAAWELMRKQATVLVKTGFLPDAIKTAEQAMAVMLKGRELGIPPMYALSNVAIIKGKPTCNAELMLALIYRDHGNDACRWETDATNPQIQTIRYKRQGWAEYQKFSFTIQQAQAANLATTATWKQYPAAMLRARCVSAMARAVFPDTIGGMYTPEELGEQVTIDEVIEAYQEPAISGFDPDEFEPVVNEVTGEIIELDDGSPIAGYLSAIEAAGTENQLQQIAAELRDAGIDDDGLRYAWGKRVKEISKAQPELLAVGAADDPERHTR